MNDNLMQYEILRYYIKYFLYAINESDFVNFVCTMNLQISSGQMGSVILEPLK